MDIQDENKKRELRVLNRKFSVGEYGDSWTKMERFLFIEIYNTIKTFYMAESAENILEFGGGHITTKIPVSAMDKRFFKAHNRSSQLLEVAESLSKKQISLIQVEEDGQLGFDFITMFPRITYNPLNDKKHLYVQIQSAVYEEMVPIESYCQLDLKLLGEFNSGNTIRLYEIFKSYAFKRSFTIRFETLRKLLGFFKDNKYPEWRYFNNQVLKPAVIDINNYKDHDIEVSYKKTRGSDLIEFKVHSHVKQSHKALKVLCLDEPVSEVHRVLNMIQDKYIETVISYRDVKSKISDKNELKEWIITDIIMQQKKQGVSFNFKHALNAISKQIALKQYTEPYAHKHISNKLSFSDETYTDIMEMERKGEIRAIRAKYTDEEIKLHRFSYLLDINLDELDTDKVVA